MGNRNKEDERIERAIRSLMKLPENRRCINCNNLGPQYVCTTFSTFVCMNCSGIHREFTHRVKSVSVAKFTAEEVTALQSGGNERARQVYFRQWDLQRHSFPDSSNLNKLRDFIKHVYVDRKYAGERSSTAPPRHSSIKKADSHRSRSSYDEEMYEKSLAGRRFGKSDDLPSRSHYSHPKNTPLSSVYPWSGNQRRNPVRFEVVDDRVRDEGFGSHRFSHGDATMQRRLSNKTNANMERYGSHAVRPLEEILGENLPTLRVGEIPKESNGENADRSASNQDSATGKAVETKIETTQSLIDFDAETEPSNYVSPSQTQQTSSLGGCSSRASPENQNSSKDSQVPKVKTLESLLFELSVPSLNTTDGVSEVPGGDVLPEPLQRIPQSIDGVDSVPNQPSNDDDILQGTCGDGATVKVIEWLFESIQQTQKASPSLADASSSFPHLTTSIGAQDNEPRFASSVHNEVGSSSVLPLQPSQSVSRPVQDAIAGAENQPLPEAPKSSSRMELPVDLFTASYPSMATPISGWQSVPPQGMGFNYYPSTMPVSAFPSQAKSTNPFDMSDEQSQFPSMSSIHAALPNVFPASSSLGNYSTQLTPPQSLANAYMMPQQPTYIGSALSPSAYMGQEVHNIIQPARPQGFGGPVSDGDVFISINTAQQPAAIYSDHANLNSSMGGNPFG